MDNLEEKLVEAPDMYSLIKIAVDEGSRIEREFFNKKLDVLIETLKEAKFRDIVFSADQIISFISCLKEK